MANTTYSEIYDSFLTSVRDYKLDKLYNINPDDFNDYLLGFMKKAIVNFDNCSQDLTNRDDEAQTFNITLTPLEIEIISSLMVIEWLNKEINDVTQMSLHITNPSEFRTYSEAQNLKEKTIYRNILKEEASHLMTIYGLKNVPWSEWAVGNYENS